MGIGLELSNLEVGYCRLGKLLIIAGGVDAQGGGGDWTETNRVLGISDGYAAWDELPRMYSPRRNARGAPFGDSILVIGRSNGDWLHGNYEVLHGVEMYDPLLCIWLRCNLPHVSSAQVTPRGVGHFHTPVPPSLMSPVMTIGNA